MASRRIRAALVAALSVLAGSGLWLQLFFERAPGRHQIEVVVPSNNTGRVAFQLDRYRGAATPVSEFRTVGPWRPASPVILALPSGSGRASYHGVVDSAVAVRFLTGFDGGEAQLVVDGNPASPVSLRSVSDGDRVIELHFAERVPAAAWALLALMVGICAAMVAAAVWCLGRLYAQRGATTAAAVAVGSAALGCFAGVMLFASPAVVRAAGTLASISNQVGIGAAIWCLVVLAVSLVLGVRPVTPPAWVTSPETRRDRWRLTLLLGLVPFLGWLALLLVFWPGLMNPDSLAQWFELDRDELSNWHPYTFAVVLGVLRRVIDTPALPILLQTVAAALLTGRIAAWTVWRGRSPWVAAGTLVLLPALPPTGLFTVTLWKDAPFGIALLGFTLVVWRIEDTKGRWLADRLNVVLAVITIITLWLTRHNGWPIVIGTVVVLVMARRELRRRVLVTVVAAMTIVLIVEIPVAQVLGVRANPVPSIIYVQHIAMHVNNATKLTVSDRRLLETVYPLDRRWPYACSSIQQTWSGPQAIPMGRYKDKASELRSIAVRLALRDPGAELRHVLCSSEIVWNPRDGKGVTYFLEWSEVAGHIDYIPGADGAGPMEDPGSTRATARIFDGVMHTLPVWVIRPAVYLYAFLAAIAVAARRRCSWRVVSIAVPVVIQSVTLAALTLTQDVRFQYGVILTAVALVPALLTVSRPRSPQDDRPLVWFDVRHDRRRPAARSIP